MEAKQNLFKGVMILSIGSILTKIIGLIYRIPLTNILGDEGNGLFSSAYQVYVIILTLTATAIPSGLSKLIAEQEALENYKEANRIFKIVLKGTFCMALVLGVGVSIGADWISATFFEGKNIGLPIRILTPTILITSIVASLRGYFQGIGDMMPIAESQVIEQAVHVVFTIALAAYFIRISLISAVTGAVVGTSIGAMAALTVLVSKYVKANKIHKELISKQTATYMEKRSVLIKKILAVILPVMISTSVFAFICFIDLSMISNILPYSVEKLREAGKLATLPLKDVYESTTSQLTSGLAGIYSFQYSTFINVPVALVLQIAAATIPAITMSVAIKDQKAVDEKIEMVFRLGFILGAPSAVAFFLFGVPIIKLVVANGTGGEVLSAGAIGLIFITVAQLSAAVIQAMGKQLNVCIHAVVVCLIKVVMNYFLMRIPQLNVYGVIHSTTLCYLIYSILNLIYLYKVFNIKVPWSKVAFKPLLCAGIMGGISYTVYVGAGCVIHSTRWTMIVAIPVAVVVYVIAVMCLGALTEEDLKQLPGGEKLSRLMKRMNIRKEKAC